VKNLSRFRTISAATLLLALTLFIARQFFTPKPGTIEYHLRELGSLRNQYPPHAFKDYLRLRTWRWYAHGQPDLVKAWQQQEDALIQLGYFQKRDFPLKHPIVDGNQFWTAFHSMADARITEPRFMLHLNDTPPIIGITTTPHDLPIFQLIINQLDEHNTNATPSTYEPL
jgi:hypothetical protein